MASTTRSRAAGAGTGSIGLVSCVAFAVGTMVGAGVFVLSGLAVERAGPAAIAAFVLAGFLVLLSALSFAVVASLATPGGSGYAYVGQALGPRWGFLTSWAFWLGGVIGIAFVLNAFGSYLNQFFVSAVPATAVAVAAVIVIALLNLGPASLIGRAETALVVVKVSILVLLIVFAFVHLGRAQFTPFAPHGPSAVISTSALLFIAYLGFNVVTNMAGDVERPQRTIPLAILLSMGIVALIYVGVVVALLAGQITTYDEASVGTAAKHLIGDWGGILIPIGALLSTLSAANANMLGSSEIMVRLAGDRQVPTVVGRLWRGHPAVSVLAAASIAVILVLIGGVQVIVALGNVAAIVAMVLVNAAAFHSQRHQHRAGIKLPAGPLLPALGLLAALVQLFFIGWWQTLIGLALVAAGFGLYALRGHHQAGHHAVITDHLNQNAGPAGRALRRPSAKGA